MKDPKLDSASDDSVPTTPIEGRRRVTKACQRCRLKKCKCDGSSPCGRCKADNAICAYGKHKKSDRTVYRKGYVQMLERQHAQLVAGVREMYRLLQNSDGWPGAALEASSQTHGQPLTHQILEALGVLQQFPPLDDEDGLGAEWQTFEHHPQDGGMEYNSTHHSPDVRAPLSLPSPTPTPLAAPGHPSLLERRIMKNETGSHRMERYNAALPQITTLLPNTNIKGETPFSADIAYQFQDHQIYPDQFSDIRAYDDTLGLGGITPSINKPEMVSLDWMGMEDAFDPTPAMLQPFADGMPG